MEIGDGDWRWRLEMEIGDWRWRLEMEIGDGDGRWEPGQPWPPPSGLASCSCRFRKVKNIKIISLENSNIISKAWQVHFPSLYEGNECHRSRQVFGLFNKETSTSCLIKIVASWPMSWNTCLVWSVACYMWNVTHMTCHISHFMCLMSHVTGLDISWVMKPTSRVLNINKIMSYMLKWPKMTLFGQKWPFLTKNYGRQPIRLKQITSWSSLYHS